VAYPDAGVVVAAYRRGALPSDIDSVVIHELAHLALGAALGPKAPRWLHEGFAYIHSSDFSLDRTRTLTGMAWTGDVIPLADLDRSFPAEENAAARAYAQSYDFVSFLAKRGRYSGPEDDGNRWPFRQLLVDLAGGKTLDQAAREEFSSTLKQLFGEWQNSLRDRYLTVPVSVLGAAVWVLCALLLVVGFVRKRRQGRRTLARWAVEEAGQPDEVLSDDELAAADGVDPDGRDDAAPEVVTSEGSAPHDPSVADPPGAERPADADQPVAVDPPRRRHGRDPGDLPN
jgi:hypothetical protein